MPEKPGEQEGERQGSSAAPVEGGDAVRGSSGGAGQPMMDLDFVRGLITAVDESGIDTLEINRGGTRIKISKTPAQVIAAGGLAAGPAPQLAAAYPGSIQAAPTAPPPAVPTAEATATASATEPAKELVEVKSPMVGTFYRAPAPEAPPYVEVGSSVTKGQTLCILEAMKLMNELEAEVDGVVREILVSNAEPVQYGQVLFRIEPTGS